MSNTVSMTIIGGGWGHTEEAIKVSGVVNKLAAFFPAADVHNGGYINAIPQLLHDLNIWMPDIPNSSIKEYPLKPKGSCLIVSKVIRGIEGEHPYFQPLTRIFRMSGNAVIAIDKTSPICEFALIDALGNIWVKTTSIEELAEGILRFYAWSRQQVRKGLKNTLPVMHPIGSLESFLNIVRINARNIVNGTKDRFFGNCSTRCMSLFPSSRYDGSETFMVSARNSSKEGIQSSDTVMVNANLEYYGDRKPSVDTPVQVELYKHFHNINYMIHGHAFFTDAVSTNDYFPCGDMREAEAVKALFPNQFSDFFVVNLKNHGFLVGSARVNTLNNFLTSNIPTMQPFRYI